MASCYHVKFISNLISETLKPILRCYSVMTVGPEEDARRNLNPKQAGNPLQIFLRCKGADL
jgi:hypothetical protein